MSEIKKKCFVIAPIGEEESETRKRSDQVLRHIIGPAADTCGYDTVRADEIDRPGIITFQVIQHVVDDDLVVADLTDSNPNVFYELAIRHALGKPLVQIIKKGEDIPFDVAGTRTISVDHTDLDGAETAREDIVNQIRALEEGSSDIQTPISVALDLQFLRRSDNPEERSLGELFAVVVDLWASVRKIDSRFESEDQGETLDEIRFEIDSLSSRIDDHLMVTRTSRWESGPIQPDVEPILELLRSDTLQTPASEILIIASVFRNWWPWLYDLAVEVSRVARHGSRIEFQTAAHEFTEAVNFAYERHFSRQLFDRDDYMNMIRREIARVLNNALSRPRIDG